MKKYFVRLQSSSRAIENRFLVSQLKTRLTLIVGATSLIMSLSLSSQETTQSEALGYVDAETLRPALDRHGIIDVEGGKVLEHLDFDLGLWLGYSDDPLVYYNQSNNELSSRERSLVSQRLGANLLANIGLLDWLSLGIDVPVILYQNGATNIPGVPVANNISSLSSAGLGDIRFTPKLRLLNAERHGVNLALLGHLRVPSNLPKGNWFGEPGVRFAPTFALSRFYDRIGLKWAANIGVNLRNPFHVESLDVGQDLDLRLGLSYAFDKLGLPLHVDVSGRTSFQAWPNPFSDESKFENGSEWNALVGYNISDKFDVFVGGGTGIVTGAGIPDYRVFGGLRYSRTSNKDLDGDGVRNKDDQCPEAAEDIDGFQDEDGCPDEDNDGDGVLDTNDVCADSVEDADGFKDEDGCLDADNDEDGILDAEDKCPLVVGLKELSGCPMADKDGDGVADDQDQCPDEAGTRERYGCPIKDQDGDGLLDADDTCPTEAGPRMFKGCPDTDGDGLPDNSDKCPNEAEIINGVEDEDGCPDEGKTLVKLSDKKIEILESVYFETGKSKIKEVSFNLLNQVSTLLRAHPELKKIRVEGHTDSVGSDAKNMSLSQARAEAVQQYLVDHGVSPLRLKAQGFGETQPIDDNATKAGRSKNRRVNFVVTEQNTN